MNSNTDGRVTQAGVAATSTKAKEDKVLPKQCGPIESSLVTNA